MNFKMNFKGINKGVDQLLKNKYVLYALAFISATNILAYLTLKNYNAVLFFLSIALLSTYFTKNMIINLGVSLFLTNLLYVKSTYEGLENQEDTQEEVEMEEPEMEEPEMEEPEMEEQEEEAEDDGEVEEPEEEMEEPEMEEPEEEMEMEEQQDDKLGLTSNLNEAFTLLSSNIEGMKNRKPKKKVNKKKKTKQGFRSKQMNDPKSMPSSLNEEDIGKRIDYASTLEAAYDNLQGMLGKEGISGLTKETQNLISQQKSLMGTLGEIQPLIKNAKETLNTFNMGDLNKGIGSISSMLKNLKQ
jgi:hypothetical protein